MTSPTLRTVCFLLGFLTHYAVVFVHTLPYWKVSNWQVSTKQHNAITRFWFQWRKKRGDGWGGPSQVVRLENAFLMKILITSSNYYKLG